MGLASAHPLPEVALPATGFLRQPKITFLAVIDGAPVTSDLSSLASFNVVAESDETSSQLLSRMLSGKVADSDSLPASVGDLLCQLHEESVFLTVSSRADLLGALSVNSQLLKSHPEWNVFGAQVDLGTSAVTMKGKAQNSLKKALEDLLSPSNLEGGNIYEAGVALFDERIKVCFTPEKKGPAFTCRCLFTPTLQNTIIGGQGLFSGDEAHGQPPVHPVQQRARCSVD